jgi:hypothetical protein
MYFYTVVCEQTGHVANDEVVVRKYERKAAQCKSLSRLHQLSDPPALDAGYLQFSVVGYLDRSRVNVGLTSSTTLH